MTEHLVARLRADFLTHYGAEPDAVAVAPGRVNLIGEHVDYNGGRCLPMAISQSTYAAVRLRRDTRVTIRSRQAGTWTGEVTGLGPGEATGWAAYAAGVVWAMRQPGPDGSGLDVPGFDLFVDGHVPLGAGLSSSAALECSVALAVAAALDLPLDEQARRALVAHCIRAEREVAGAPTGGMDQTVSMLGRTGHALLLDCATGATADVPWRPEAAGLALLVVDTRATHALVDGEYAQRRAECEDAAALLGVDHLAAVPDPHAALERLADDPVRQRRARHVLTEVARVGAAVAALRGGDFAAFGDLLTASHLSLRDEFEVSCAELDVAVETCLAVGALGARMTGGGFGGSAIALLPEPAVDAAEGACADAFAARGWEAPRFLRATAADGARVVVD